jgi:hypothetical protein
MASYTSEEHPTPFGNAAVSGLFSGLIGGLVMALVMVLLAVLNGGTPDKMLSRFSTGIPGSAITGILTHLAMSAVYGILFGILLHGLRSAWKGRIAGWLAGFVYGFILFLMAAGLILPNSTSSLIELPLGCLLLGHLSYGLGLGLAYRR